jgi:hypothetical protein
MAGLLASAGTYLVVSETDRRTSGLMTSVAPGEERDAR